MKKFRFSLLLILLFLFQQCATLKPKKLRKAINNNIENSTILNQHFVGFVLYDIEKKQTLYKKNASKYFTPASNTKLFTFYTSLKMLGDSIPAMRYVNKGDSLIFWGTGDPSFLHLDSLGNSKAYDFLSTTDKKLFLSTSNYIDARFGAGWAWDDYNYYFSPDRSVFPIYGNVVKFNLKGNGELPQASPPVFKNSIQIGLSETVLLRNEMSNSFTFTAALDNSKKEKNIPFKYSEDLLIKLLSDTLKKEVTAIKIPYDTASKVIYSIPADSLYKKLLQISDNFVAEQLLVLCGSTLGDSITAEKVIDYAKENFLADLPDEPIWRDGSGLSRYNLITPRSIVKLLEKIYEEVPEKRLLALLPSGGESGTIEKYYAAERPYIFAKTGTLSNNHCLSGYLVTNSGRRMIFSFMHNHYINGSAPAKEEMERILKMIRDTY